MKSFLLMLICFICVIKSYGQITVEITKEKNKIFSNVEVKKGLCGTDSSWVKNLKKKISESIQDCKQIKKGKYILSVKFILSKDGSIADISCENDPGYGVCEKIIRVVKKSKSCGWKPSEPVKVREVY